MSKNSKFTKELVRLSKKYEVPVPKLIVSDKECNKSFYEFSALRQITNKPECLVGLFLDGRIILRPEVPLNVLYHEFKHYLRWLKENKSMLFFYKHWTESEHEADEFAEKEFEERIKELGEI